MAFAVVVAVVSFLGGVVALFLGFRTAIRGAVESALKESLGWVPEFRAASDREREHQRREHDEIFARLRAVEIEQARREPR